jgi:hypothetical protein
LVRGQPRSWRVGQYAGHGPNRRLTTETYNARMGVRRATGITWRSNADPSLISPSPNRGIQARALEYRSGESRRGACDLCSRVVLPSQRSRLPPPSPSSDRHRLGGVVILGYLERQSRRPPSRLSGPVVNASAIESPSQAPRDRHSRLLDHPDRSPRRESVGVASRRRSADTFGRTDRYRGSQSSACDTAYFSHVGRAASAIFDHGSTRQSSQTIPHP